MNSKISIVINTLNEEENLQKALNSVKWADEILVCDMHSDDQTQQIAKKSGAKVILHEKTGFVEPARNFAISNTRNDWILILDADEEIPSILAQKLQSIAESEDSADFYKIPRKNIIFKHWMKASMWWPDYNIRFFKKGKVTWSNKIHRPPETKGMEGFLEETEDMAIIHNHYSSISQFILRLDRYTSIQARELIGEGYKFKTQDLISKPLDEFLSRFFANKGFKDGLHGAALSLLQAFSFLIMYLKVWELQGFKEEDITWKEIKDSQKISSKQINYWIKYGNLSTNPLKSFLEKTRNKFS